MAENGFTLKTRQEVAKALAGKEKGGAVKSPKVILRRWTAVSRLLPQGLLE